MGQAGIGRTRTNRDRTEPRGDKSQRAETTSSRGERAHLKARMTNTSDNSGSRTANTAGNPRIRTADTTDSPRSRTPVTTDARHYLVIDLRSFYASVECVDRHLDPLQADLVVADPTRSPNTICLAVSPHLKAQGVRNRCRLREIPTRLSYVCALPRMRRYMEVSCDVLKVYLSWFAPDDIWPYSVDEAFIDVTPYLRLYDKDAAELGRMVKEDVLKRTGIPATCGVGPNMFLAKVALDVLAKHEDDGVAVLDRRSFFRKIWFHHPITDIWGIGPGISRRLVRRGAYDLAGICLLGPQAMKAEFGKNGAWLLDHAWGLEPATIAQCREYVPRDRSISNGQVLMRNYGFYEARTVLKEMAWQSCLDLRSQGLAASSVGAWCGYSGWAEGLGAGGQSHLFQPTASERELLQAVLALWDERVDQKAPIRRLGVWFSGLVPAGEVQPTLFDQPVREEHEEALAAAIGRARRRFGPTAVLTATSLMPGANAMERNLMIGGHRA